jgi:dolichol-phosphate mannosyltransferase
MTGRISCIEIVLPAYNEARSIAATIEEFHAVAAAAGFRVSFRVCEDGSTDGTVEVLRDLACRLPLVLDSVAERRGYSQAALAGLRASEGEIVGFIDSDGQCDPHDLPALLTALDGVDLVVGYRSPRVDPFVRRLMSLAFRIAFERAFPVRRHDPSCPYMLIRRASLDRVLAGHPGVMSQGFWWEFSARAYAAGLTVREVPVHHRARVAGQTQVYRVSKVPGIAWQHLVALGALRHDIAAIYR